MSFVQDDIDKMYNGDVRYHWQYMHDDELYKFCTRFATVPLANKSTFI